MEPEIVARDVNIGATTNSDSGGLWLYNNELVGIHSGSVTTTDIHGDTYQVSSATDLHYAKDFFLKHIDGWHFPTLVDVKGTTTIKVQSLHQNPSRDAATTTGDVTLVGGTCLGVSHIDAFETCTYEIESSGGEGTNPTTSSEWHTLYNNAGTTGRYNIPNTATMVYVETDQGHSMTFPKVASGGKFEVPVTKSLGKCTATAVAQVWL